MEGFNKAVEGNNAWYAAHGEPSYRQVVAPVIVYDEANHRMKVSTDTIATIHYYPLTATRGQPHTGDDWDAFVALF